MSYPFPYLGFLWKRTHAAFSSRSEYIQQLLADICHYYGYNEFLAEKLFHLFSVDEV
jgi:25S rRNA (cytosine2870-C5)-methyltransferase